jgi:mevalonate kinase
MTEKEIFEVVKYFKDIYTNMNQSEEVFFKGKRFFYKNNPHFLLHGELLGDDNNVFVNWISKTKSVKVRIKDMDELRNCLKKNIVSLDISEKEFKLTYKDREEVQKVFLCSEEDESIMDQTIDKIETISKELKGKEKLDSSKIDSLEILELYSDGQKLLESRTDDKIIEIPVKRIVSLMKESEYSIRFSNKNEQGRRYVEISSQNQDLSMSQIFATI